MNLFAKQRETDRYIKKKKKPTYGYQRRKKSTENR